MIADEVMTRDPVTVTEQVSIGDALALLAEQSVRHLPVVRGSTVVGILSDRDFRALGLALVIDEASYEQMRGQLSQPVSTLMSSNVVTIDRDTNAADIVDLMIEEKLSALPVVENGTQELAGIVSYVDLLRVSQPMLEVG
jgi:CBS-domain-containing membrane protein